MSNLKKKFEEKKIKIKTLEKESMQKVTKTIQELSEKLPGMILPKYRF